MSPLCEVFERTRQPRFLPVQGKKEKETFVRINFWRAYLCSRFSALRFVATEATTTKTTTNEASPRAVREKKTRSFLITGRRSWTRRQKEGGSQHRHDKL